jgi:hypothetical protein
MTMRNLLSSVAVATSVTVVQGCGAITTSLSGRGDAEVNATAVALAEFRERVDEYMELRADVVEKVGEAELTDDPAVIWAREQALAQRIRARCAGAKHGDIFTPEIRVVFRRLLKPELQGEQGQDVRFKLQDDAPAPDAITLEVNARYPSGLPFPTTPAPLLLALPPLPPMLEFRIIGMDLILLDQPADVILDYIRNAITPAAVVPAG